MSDIDLAQVVTAYKDLENFAMGKMDDSEKARFLEKRAVNAEEMLARITLDQAKVSILTKFPKVEPDDIAEAKTVTEAEKMAARIQAKADKLEAQFNASFEEKLKGGLTAEEWAKVQKATGRPRQPQDETQNQTTDAEQRKELGSKLEADDEFTAKDLGDMKGVEKAARIGGRKGLEMLLGGGR